MPPKKRRKARKVKQDLYSLEESLFDAIQKHDSKSVKKLLDKGVDPNAESFGFPALGVAAEQGSKDCVELLIQAGADLDASFEGGMFCAFVERTPLTEAAGNGHLACVRALVEAGADIHQIADYTGVPLVAAGKNGHFDCMQFLLESGAEVNFPLDDGDNSPFFYLLSDWRTPLKSLQIFLKAGADVTARNDDSIQALEMYTDMAMRESKMMFQDHRLGLIAGMFFAAGADLRGVTVEKRLTRFFDDDDCPPLVDVFKYTGVEEPEELTLMNICRKMIRGHLMQQGAGNLFVKVPQLEIPKELQEHLLYFASVDFNYEGEDKEETDDEDEEKVDEVDDFNDDGSEKSQDDEDAAKEKMSRN